MLFSSASFLFYFLPITVILYFAVPDRYRNGILLMASLIFYFWGEPKYSLLMLFSAFSGYLHGLWIEAARKTKWAKVPVVSSVIVHLALLAFFKYADFFIGNINGVFGSSIPLLKIVLPIGISFYTFQILSYTIDVYRGEACVQKSFIRFATYVSLFPQLIAGPIVRYSTVEDELKDRAHSIEGFAAGVSRFVVGLSKKILIADALAELIRHLEESAGPTVLGYFIIAVAFTLQIYFDFSGYSDMAIGLGRIFGFHFLENFNYPYISRSITEFWRRWHISLGTWFRDYVYIPLGGNRVGRARWYLNILIVWFLTGFWHGAEWNFILWGVYFGVLLLIEKNFLLAALQKLPAAVGHLYTMALVVFGFVLFRANSFAGALESFSGMFGGQGVPFASAETLYYLRSYAAVLALAFVASTPLFQKLLCLLRNRPAARRLLRVAEPMSVALLLILAAGYLVDGSFSPFLYFRF